MEPYHEDAEHLGPQFADTKAACDEVVRRGSVRYLAHYTSGVFDFSSDTLGDPPNPSDSLPGTSRRDELRGLGRQLSFVVNSIEKTLLEARTGGLIRTVLQTEHGAVFCVSVVPREYVVGVVFGDHVSAAPEVIAADKAVSRLATRLRKRIRLPSLNPGGWEGVSRPTSRQGPAGARGYRAGAQERQESTPAAHQWPAGPDEDLGPVVSACTEAIRPAGLQLVAYCTETGPRFVVDHLDHSSLSPFFTQVTVDARRRFYRKFAGELCELARKLDRTVRTSLGGQLFRFVLDVEQGAVYYHRLGLDDYLTGVTLDQSTVNTVDARMSQLVDELRQ